MAAPNCFCGISAICVAVAIYNTNHNRKFFFCQNRACDYFEWAPQHFPLHHTAPTSRVAESDWPNCKHELPCMKNRDDNGRLFYGCSLAGSNACDFVKWIDENSAVGDMSVVMDEYGCPVESEIFDDDFYNGAIAAGAVSSHVSMRQSRDRPQLSGNEYALTSNMRENINENPSNIDIVHTDLSMPNYGAATTTTRGDTTSTQTTVFGPFTGTTVRNLPPSLSRPDSSGMVTLADKPTVVTKVDSPVMETGKSVRIGLSLTKNGRFKAKILEGRFDPRIRDAFGHIMNNVVETPTQCWSFPLHQYSRVLDSLYHCGLPVLIDKIPNQALKGAQSWEKIMERVKNEGPVNIESKIPEAMVKALMGFQLTGVKYILDRGGRGLIGDEMGLGKTIQALSVATYYRNEWPLLIVTPSSVRMSWKDEIIKWIPSDCVRRSDIQVITNGKDEPNKMITITSFELATKMKDLLTARNFRVVIIDESHYLKSRKTNRTKALTPIINASSRAILLSGTPALNRPEELFPQLHALFPSVWASFAQFSKRYCDAKQGRFGWDTSGYSNLDELHSSLSSSVLIRRLKKDVLTELPPKRRQKVILEVSNQNRNSLKKIQDKLSELSALVEDGDGEARNEHRRQLTMLYSQSGNAKLQPVLGYIDTLIQSEAKFLVFAHHRLVLDGIENRLVHDKVKYIRIDGSTPIQKRHEFVQKFQDSDDYRVAVLSITAAGHGITLSAASQVVFAELYWVPGVLVQVFVCEVYVRFPLMNAYTVQMTQAEDRAHRIGQKDSVNVHYLVARHTCDDIMWPVIERKINVVGESIDGERGAFNAVVRDNAKDILKRKEEVEKERIESYFQPIFGMVDDPDVSKSVQASLEFAMSQPEETIVNSVDKKEDTKQKDITSFFHSKSKGKEKANVTGFQPSKYDLDDVSEISDIEPIETAIASTSKKTLDGGSSGHKTEVGKKRIICIDDSSESDVPLLDRRISSSSSTITKKKNPADIFEKSPSYTVKPGVSRLLAENDALTQSMREKSDAGASGMQSSDADVVKSKSKDVLNASIKKKRSGKFRRRLSPLGRGLVPVDEVETMPHTPDVLWHADGGAPLSDAEIARRMQQEEEMMLQEEKQRQIQQDEEIAKLFAERNGTAILEPENVSKSGKKVAKKCTPLLKLSYTASQESVDSVFSDEIVGSGGKKRRISKVIRSVKKKKVINRRRPMLEVSFSGDEGNGTDLSGFVVKESE